MVATSCFYVTITAVEIEDYLKQTDFIIPCFPKISCFRSSIIDLTASWPIKFTDFCYQSQNLRNYHHSQKPFEELDFVAINFSFMLELVDQKIIHYLQCYYFIDSIIKVRYRNHQILLNLLIKLVVGYQNYPRNLVTVVVVHFQSYLSADYHSINESWVHFNFTTTIRNFPSC